MSTTVEQARSMGFDEETIADLLAQGILREAVDAPWRPATLEDVNWLVGKHREYDAEEQRLAEQYERRLKAITARRQWLARYAEDCRDIVADNLPRKKDGTPRQQFLDLEDGRVKLKQVGGKLEVNESEFLAHVSLIGTALETFPGERRLCDAVRVEQVVRHEGVEAAPLIGAPGWKASVLKTPIAEFLKEHPTEQVPGVSVTPLGREFVIENGGAK